MSSIQKFTASDLPAAGRMLAATKLTLTINKLLWLNWPNELEQVRQSTSALEASMNSSDTEMWKLVDDSTQAFLGLIVITDRKGQEGSPVASNKEDKPQAKLSSDLNPAVLDSVNRTMDTINKDMPEDAIEMVFIVLATDQRRKGLGTKLIQIVKDKAVREGKVLRLCTEPQAYEFCRKAGFSDVTHCDMDLTLHAPKYSGYGIFRLTGMIWRPE